MIDKLQMCVALLWPFLRWVLAIDVTWQFARMVYFWRAPDVYAGWTFLCHFGVLLVLTCFIIARYPRRF